MEIILFLILKTLFSYFVATRAERLNRSYWNWFIASFLLSPLLVWIVLEISGQAKTKEEIIVLEKSI